MISSTRTTTRTGAPGLVEIPVLGHLFGSDSKNAGRTELIVLLKARIIRDQVTTNRVMTDLLTDMRELQNRGLVPVAH